MPTADPALLDLFRAELETHLPALGEGLLALEKDPAQPKRLEALMRAAHSIKGAARIVGIDLAVRVAHALEDCFVAAQNGRVTLGSDAIDVLLRGVDTLSRVASAGEEVDEATVQGLIVTIQSVKSGVRNQETGVRGQESGGEKPIPVSSDLPATTPLPTATPMIRPVGNLDAAQANAVRAELLDLLRQGVPRIQLDLAAVRDIDADGLALLALAARAATAGQPPVTFEVHNAAPQMRTLLRLTRLDGTYSVAGEGT
jgi:two-component system sensor histidine kinase and response regulator WspE